MGIALWIRGASRVSSDARMIDDAMAQIKDAAERQLGAREFSQLEVSPDAVIPFSDDLPETLDEERRAALLNRVQELEPWLQGPFALGGDLVIGGAWRNDTRWQGLSTYVPDLEQKRVLDVGANAGYDSFMFKRRGASGVMACEPFEFIHQMEFLEGIYQTGITPRRLAWQELDPDTHGTFDVVHCHGVLYHEMHPLALIQRLWAMLAEHGTLLFGSMMLEAAELSEYARFVPGSYFGDPTWWWIPGRLTMRWMLEAVGFDVEDVFGLSPGPPGEFPTVNGYFRARRGHPSESSTVP
jgi:2-polyprenyl-3-methyl-5-hydroxy-6-metoxy-1,4-benzoquinol methylase